MNDQLFWLGWRASFPDLERAGWKCTVEHRNDYLADMNEYIFNLTHPNHKLIGRARNRVTNTKLHMLEMNKVVSPFGIMFPMEIFFSNEIHIVSFEKGLPNYTEVKMDFNNYMELAKFPYNMEDHRVLTSDLFKTVQPNEIIVPQTNIDGLLEQVLKVQDPKQTEIRERIRKESLRNEYKTKTEEVARIITVAA
ncbi:MAG: hypothetical protein ACW98X_27760 [Promethearchaeota archaeon]|jgi:hypothetical protein